MTREDELPDVAKNVIDTNRYMVLGTADPTGLPWVSPVYFAHDGYRDFYWVSSPTTRHSRNVAVRTDVSIAVFDSSVAVGSARAVYMTATASEVPEAEIEAGAQVFNTPKEPRAFVGPEDMRGDGPFRLYCATAQEQSVLVRGSDPDLGRGFDSRYPVTLTD
jgi:uncharacterized protein YhbP (UPF0306 family)